MLDFHILGPSSAFDLQTSRVTLLCIANSNDDLFSTETSVLNGSVEAETCVGSGNKNRFPAKLSVGLGTPHHFSSKNGNG